MPRGNPDIPAGPGRPKGSKNKAPAGLGLYIREQTNDGKEIADAYVQVLRGERLPLAKRRPTTQDRLKAGEWLADRAFGRAKQSVEIEGSETLAELLEAALGGHGSAG